MERLIPETNYTDVIGCYPLFCCLDWTGLPDDLEQLARHNISLALVADTFGDYSLDALRQNFDVVREFKDHFIIDLEKYRKKVLSRRHRRNTAFAMNSVKVEVCQRPQDYLDEWCSLYRQLCLRHNITGLRALSRSAHSFQLGAPGLVMFRAMAGVQTVGMLLWFQRGSFAYSHLVATNNKGYELRAQYALYWSAIEYFQGRVRCLDIGGIPGTTSMSNEGLASFKRGWSTETRIVHFCGRIFDQEKYDQLAARYHAKDDFFPAYRTA